jgi:hypothetical protein
MSTPTTPPVVTPATSIEPPWAGSERTIENGFKWAILVFGLLPLLMGIAIYIIATLFTITLPIVFIYGLGILFGGIPFLKYMETKGRLCKTVKSQRVVIVTSDMLNTSSREASDSREETKHDAFKLGEGFHILDPFDQEYVDIAIEIDYRVSLTNFRITLGDKGGMDLEVKSAIATFRTNSEETLLLARISTDETEREKRIQENMKEYTQRFIETAFREEFRIDPNVMDRLDKISTKVEKQLKKVLKKGWGLHLKSFTLGNVDVPQAVEAARNEYAVMEQLRHASVKLMEEHNVGLDPHDPRRLTPEKALELTLVAIGRIPSTRQNNTDNKIFKFDQATLDTIRILFQESVALFKKDTPTSTTTP